MTDEPYAGLTQLGHHARPADTPEEAVLERVADPAPGASITSCASPARNSPRSAR